MTREKLIELLTANDSLLNRIGAIIDYGDVSDQSIEDAMHLPWGYEEGSGMIYYARHEGESMYDYCGVQVSSLAMKGEKYYMGESDGLTYAMVYPEDENWDDTYLLILDNKNKESLTDGE